MKEKFLGYVDNCSITSDFADENADNCVKITKQEMLFFGEWIFDQFNLNKDIPVSKILEEYLIINNKL